MSGLLANGCLVCFFNSEQEVLTAIFRKQERFYTYMQRKER